MSGRVSAWRRWRRSLSARIVAAFLLLALATTLVFVGGVQRVMRGGWEAYAKPLVTDYAERITMELGAPPDVARAQAIVERLPLTLRIAGPQVNWASHPTRSHPRWRDDDPDEETGFGLVRNTADGHRIEIGLAEPAAAVRSRAFSWLVLGALLALTLLAWGWVRHLLKPIDDIRAGAERFGAGEFGTPIARRRDDELGDLAERINTMAARLRDRLDAQRALLLAISHELRSPLTRARVNAELVGEGAPRDALLRDLAGMRDLIEDLLESERLAGGGALKREPLDLAALTAPWAERGVAVRIEPGVGRPLADPTRVALLLRNLLDNALRHGHPPVRLTVRRDGTDLEFVVRDHGPGVEPAQLARLSEPFWRPDAARSRDAGGVGLGLYLCRLVAQAHGGRIEFWNASPGLEVVVRWPAGPA